MNVAAATSGDRTTWRKTDRLRETEAAGITLTLAAECSMYSVHIIQSLGV